MIKVAPPAQDLSRGLFGYHLDFPGAAVAPGCNYDEWSHRINNGHPPHVFVLPYAAIAVTYMSFDLRVAMNRAEANAEAGGPACQGVEGRPPSSTRCAPR